VSVAQSVFMVVLLRCLMDLRAEDKDSIRGSNSSERGGMPPFA
jgi:hypothetical protein